MVSLKKLKISKIQKRLKMDFLKNPFLLVIGILLIIIIILIIYNYFNKKSKNIERFYFEDNFTANPENCAKIGYTSTDDEKTKCCENNFDDIKDQYKSLCVATNTEKYCTAEYLQKYPSFKDDCLANGISLPESTTTTTSSTPTSPTTTTTPTSPTTTTPPAAPASTPSTPPPPSCQVGQKVKDGQCVNICTNDREQYNTETSQCVKIFNYCKENEPDKLYWYSDDSFISGHCVNKCPIGHDANNFCRSKCTNFYENYDTDTKTCINPSLCKNINKHWLYDENNLNQGKCVDKCPDNSTIDGPSSMCIRKSVGAPHGVRD